jgi:hypothetical protein
MISWQMMKPLKQEYKLDPVMLLMSPDHSVDNVDIDRQVSYVYKFWNYLNIVLLNYFIFILWITCDYGIS